MSELKDKEGYPLTHDQFWASEERCVKLYIENKFYPAFEKAAYRAYVRFIRVDAVHNEKNSNGETKFFTRHTLESDLFRLGQYFEEEKNKLNQKKINTDPDYNSEKALLKEYLSAPGKGFDKVGAGLYVTSLSKKLDEPTHLRFRAILDLIRFIKGK